MKPCLRFIGNEVVIVLRVGGPDAQNNYLGGIRPLLARFPNREENSVGGGGLNCNRKSLPYQAGILYLRVSPIQ